MTLTTIELAKIDPNPFQVRLTEDRPHVEALAEDIAANGLLQCPLGRAHPEQPERVQLAFGHSRLAAYVILASQHPEVADWERLPVDVRDLTDRQMSDYAASENAR